MIRFGRQVHYATSCTFELPLSRLESVRLEQTIPATLLGFGSILVAGVGGAKQAFGPMARPLTFRRAAERALYGV